MELKVYNCNEWHNEYTEFYLKSEADKAIADLEESNKMEVSQLLVANREQAVNSNRLRDSMKQAIRRQKYKRCLAMAEWCDTEVGIADTDGDYEDMLWYQKWHQKWLELSEKFKEAK